MSDSSSLGAEDQRKLHAEINQLLNHRFLLTTAAITIFGAFASWTIPKDPSQHPDVLVRLLFVGASFLLLFLLLLFGWGRSLANLQSSLGVYLILKRASVWERDWRRYHGYRTILSTGSIQTCVFLALGALTTAWPFAISLACDWRIDFPWAAAELTVSLVYFVVVIGFGLLQWCRDPKEIRRKWRVALGLSVEATDEDELIDRGRATSSIPEIIPQSSNGPPFDGGERPLPGEHV